MATLLDGLGLTADDDVATLVAQDPTGAGGQVTANGWRRDVATTTLDKRLLAWLHSFSEVT